MNAATPGQSSANQNGYSVPNVPDTTSSAMHPGGLYMSLRGRIAQIGANRLAERFPATWNALPRGGTAFLARRKWTDARIGATMIPLTPRHLESNLPNEEHDVIQLGKRNRRSALLVVAALSIPGGVLAQPAPAPAPEPAPAGQPAPSDQPATPENPA
ncbi:MAG TPA: hypothetical protein VK601_19250, partial [Kofleriaceae bacterium]|nr:hypothetical protein [Kofleriaceae bacterium]